MAKKKEWREGEMIITFGLNKIVTTTTPLMDEWLDVSVPDFSVGEQFMFDNILTKAVKHIATWSEEDLKMKFLSYILSLGNVLDDDKFATAFDKKMTAKVEGYDLSVKADFVIGAGMLDYMQAPYFHFQEYKPENNPSGDSMAQLLEAFLIAQVLNNNDKPLYGCEVNGAIWKFVVVENKDYCISKRYDSTDKNELLSIIAILRKFKYILETRLLKN